MKFDQAALCECVECCLDYSSLFDKSLYKPVVNINRSYVFFVCCRHRVTSVIVARWWLHRFGGVNDLRLPSYIAVIHAWVIFRSKAVPCIPLMINGFQLGYNPIGHCIPEARTPIQYFVNAIRTWSLAHGRVLEGRSMGRVECLLDSVWIKYYRTRF